MSGGLRLASAGRSREARGQLGRLHLHWRIIMRYGYCQRYERRQSCSGKIVAYLGMMGEAVL